MPGRRGKSRDPFRGFESPSHGDRSQLEETHAAGGGGQGVPGVPAGPSDGGVPVPQPEHGAPAGPGAGAVPMQGGGGAPADMRGEDGQMRPGGPPSPARPPFPDDPDMLVKVLYRASPHPDIGRLLTPRQPESLYPGAQLNGPAPGQSQRAEQEELETGLQRGAGGPPVRTAHRRGPTQTPEAPVDPPPDAQVPPGAEPPPGEPLPAEPPPEGVV